MDSDIEKWLKIDGQEFLKSIGIKEKDIVLDFGCGEGHYAIPLAKVVGENGRVYALDEDRQSLNRLKQIINQEDLKNIKLLQEDTKVPLKDNSVDVALCYDVIHYEKNREKIYKEIYRILKKDGFLSLYPKHYKKDYPLMELASLELEDVIREIEKAGFILKGEFLKRCIHDNYYNECKILNFMKKL